MREDLLRKWHGLKRLASNAGWLATFKWALRRLLSGRPPAGTIDVFAHYDFVWPRALQAVDGTRTVGSINWFIPDFNIGSGGHLNIFRMIWNLEQKGYESRIIIVKPNQHSTKEQAKQTIRKHFFPLQASVWLGLDGLPSAEFAVATGWDTAYPVRDFEGADHKLYFVQDYEPYFFALGSDAVLAENTYRFGFFGITAGAWLAHKLAVEHGMATHAVGFGVEHDRYKQTPRREPHIRRVFFYARPPTPRRAFELGLLVLKAVSDRLPDTQFLLAGWDTATYHIPFPHLACGTVALEELPDLYSQCDVALVLSLTNVSLLPLELMACGCAVVSNCGPNVEWLVNSDVAALTQCNPQALADAICNLLTNEDERHALTKRAREYADNMSWADVAGSFEVGLKEVRVQASERVN